MTTKDWKKAKRNTIVKYYGDHIDEFMGYDDDREVYVNTYNLLLNVCDSIPDDLPNGYVRAAIVEKMRKDMKMMDEIKARFCA
ncbi:MAG: hypothetical protein J6S60_03835 [Oscillospiraceae bacterium]|nr:hypothetical protein [Oscillospiraceae bacterium]